MDETIRGKQADQTLMWVRWADADYLGARLLLLEGLLIQGSVLANTAIEKYLKAICSYAKIAIPSSHDVATLYATIKHKTPTNLDLIPGFLRLLRKAYKLRYPDDLNEGFNIVLNQVKVLCQLDRSVFELVKRFVMSVHGKPIPTVLEEAIFRNDQRFLLKNAAVNSSFAAELFSKPSHTIELRNYKNDVMQAVYMTEKVADDLLFELTGFQPDNAGQFTLAHAPIGEPNIKSTHRSMSRVSGELTHNMINER